MPKDIEPEDYVGITNLRRHESEDAVIARVNARRERVHRAREDGKTYREIAAHEGISEAQARKDDKAPNAHRCASEGQNPRVSEVSAAKNTVGATKNTDGEHADDEIVDDDEHAVPARFRALFADVRRFRSLASSCTRIATKLKEFEDSKTYRLACNGGFNLSSVMFTAAKRLADLRPSKVCDSCNGDGCAKCSNRGWFSFGERNHES
jgi:hypothetical protein